MADDQTEAIDEVTIAWLVEIAAPEDLDPESLALLKNRAAVVAFLENDDAPRYRRFAHAQLLNFFLAEVTIDTISSDEVPKFIRRNILGADFLAALSDLVLDAAASDTARVHEFFQAASRTARTYLSVDRGARNLGAMLMTVLPAMNDGSNLRLEGIAVDESLIQGTAPEAVIANAAINQLDVQDTDLRAMTFEEDCWIGTLIVDETTRVRPPVRFPTAFGVRASALGTTRWLDLLDLLREHDLIREEQLSSKGRTSNFVHIKRRTEILAADPKDTQIRDFYSSLVETIRGHDRRA